MRLPGAVGQAVAGRSGKLYWCSTHKALPAQHKVPVKEALGILEVTGLTTAMVALDTMDKTAGVRVLQTESNDFYGVVLKIVGPQAAVSTAITAGKAAAEQMGSKPVGTVLNRPDERA